MTTAWSAALVTGASSGIGAAIARRLAADGVAHLILVARRRDRLEELGTALADRYGTSIEVLPADLADPAALATVEARLASPGPRPAVDLLVNDAGLGTAGPFHASDADAEQRVIDVNVVALVRLTRAALGPMVDAGRGAVMNVSSLACYQPGPGLATYAATKAFVTLFSESVHEEVRGTGVTVTAVLPGYTRTEFAARRAEHAGVPVAVPAGGPPSFVWMSAAAVADAAVDATARGRALCVPGTGYKAVAGAVTPLPRSARRWLMGRLAGRFS